MMMFTLGYITVPRFVGWKHNKEEKKMSVRKNNDPLDSHMLRI